MVLPLRVALAATEPSADITVPKTAKRSLALAQSACSPYEWRLAVRPPKRGLESVPSGDGRLFAKLHTIFMVGHICRHTADCFPMSHVKEMGNADCYLSGRECGFTSVP